MTMTAYCACGWKKETDQMQPCDERAVRKILEVVADRHESSDFRRPYRHNTEIVLGR